MRDTVLLDRRQFALGGLALSAAAVFGQGRALAQPASVRQPILDAIGTAMNPQTRSPFTQRNVIEPIGELADLVGERYLARQNNVELPSFRGWGLIDQLKRVYSGGADSLDISLYRRGDATVAAILGIRPSLAELQTHSEFLANERQYPQSHLEARDILDRWVMDERRNIIIVGHSVGGTIGLMYAAASGVPAIGIESMALPRRLSTQLMQRTRHPPRLALNIDAVHRGAANPDNRREIIGATRIFPVNAGNALEAHDIDRIRTAMNSIRQRLGRDPRTMGPILPRSGNQVIDFLKTLSVQRP